MPHASRMLIEPPKEPPRGPRVPFVGPQLKTRQRGLVGRGPVSRGPFSGLPGLQAVCRQGVTRYCTGCEQYCTLSRSGPVMPCGLLSMTQNLPEVDEPAHCLRGPDVGTAAPFRPGGPRAGSSFQSRTPETQHNGPYLSARPSSDQPDGRSLLCMEPWGTRPAGSPGSVV